MASVNSQAQIGHVAIESAFGTAVAPTNTNAFRVIQLVTNPEQAIRRRSDKNIALGQTIGIGGKRSGSGSVRMLLVGSSAAGTAPDHGPLLQMAMGAAPVVTASTSVKYGLGSNIYTGSIWNFWNPSDASQYVSLGSAITSLSVDATGDDPIIELAFSSLWVLDTDQFATADTIARGGLSSFPAAPSAPVTNGNQISLDAGSATLDGNSLAGIRSFRLNGNFGRDIPQDVKFSGLYGVEPGQDKRDITFDLNIYDKSGDANMSSLKNKAINKTPIDVTIVMGSVAGHIVEIPLKNVQLGTPQSDDGQRKKAINFAGCTANMTTNTSNDEFAIIHR